MKSGSCMSLSRTPSVSTETGGARANLALYEGKRKKNNSHDEGVEYYKNDDKEQTITNNFKFKKFFSINLLKTRNNNKNLRKKKDLKIFSL